MSNNLTEKLKCVWLRNIQPSPLAKCVTCGPTRGQVRSCKAGQFSSLGTKSAPVYEGAVPAGGNNDWNKKTDTIQRARKSALAGSWGWWAGLFMRLSTSLPVSKSTVR